MPGPWDKSLIPTEFDGDTITSTTNGTGFKLEEGAELRCEVSVTGAVSGTSPRLTSPMTMRPLSRACLQVAK